MSQSEASNDGYVGGFPRSPRTVGTNAGLSDTACGTQPSPLLEGLDILCDRLA